MTQNAALYIRCSTEKQVQDGSHDRQRTRLIEWADRNDYDYETFVDGGVSGTVENRDRFTDLLDQVEDFDIVAVRDMSRLYRDLRRFLEQIEEFEELGVDFVSLDDPIDTTSAEGRLQLQIIGAFNEYQSRVAAERATRAAERRKEQGKQVGRPPKLSPSQQEQVAEWRDDGHTWGEIQVKVEYEMNEQVSKDTLQRYNKNVKYG